MTRRTRDKDFARRLQTATGQSYTRCLNAVRVELSRLVETPEVDHYGHACSLLHQRLDAGEVLGLAVLPMTDDRDDKPDNVTQLPSRRLPPSLQQALRNESAEHAREVERIYRRAREYEAGGLNEATAFLASLVDEIVMLRRRLGELEGRVHDLEPDGRV